MQLEHATRSEADRAGLYPVIRSILSPDALMRDVARYYAIVPNACRLLKRGLNDTYLLHAGGNRYIVRAYRARWRSESAIQCELELLLHLADHGVSVAVPLPTADGALSWPAEAPEGQRHVVLFSYAEGSRVPWESGEDAARIGRIAGAMHQATATFVSSHARPPIDFSYLADAPLVAIRPFLAARPEAMAEIEAFASHLKSRADETEGLDWGICHGDFAPKNIHMGPDRRLTIFDFDLCGPGWRAYDLGLIQWVANDHRTPALWESFLDGYSAVRPLSRADVDAIPLFHAAAHLASLGLFAENIGDWGSADMSDWLFDRELSFFRSWMNAHG